MEERRARVKGDGGGFEDGAAAVRRTEVMTMPSVARCCGG